MLKISYLGHSCFKVDDGATSIVFDPYKDNSVPGLKMPPIGAAYTLCSHGHNDHNATELVESLPIYQPLYLEQIKVPHDHHNGEHRGMNNINIVTLGKYRLAHLGDLGCIPNDEIIEKLKDIDIMFAPINGFYTISSQELYDIYQLTKPRILIPMHYYKKEDKSGYPDGNQIDKFKELFKNCIEVNSPEYIIEGNITENKIIIFNKSYQGE